MEPGTKKTSSERDHTDASLQAERSNSDRVIAETLEGTEADADELVDRARRNADDVLEAARERADRRRVVTDPPPGRAHDLARDRALEDDALRDERAVADEILRRERDEQARVLAALLPLERERTDRNLLTERKRSDDALATRDDFLGMVSHDLRNLLSGIVLNANVLTLTAREHDGGERTVAGMQRIQRYAARMSRLIGDLVDIVSIDAGRLAVSCETADATALLTEVVDSFAASAVEKGVSLELDVAAHPLLAAFDHDRLVQVLANLVTNALKFTARGGSVVVRGECGTSDLHLWVSDTGCGIDHRLFEAVFERFWQVGTNDRRGLGLGLYIARCIVAAHRGRIWVQSELGQGSEFHVEILLRANVAKHA